MILFLDALSSPAYAAVFSAADRTVAADRRFDADGKEHDVLLDQLEALLARAGTSWRAVSGIAAVVGPGGFTGTRLVTLMANSVGWALGTPLYAVDAFQLCRLARAPLPHAARANRNEYLVIRRDGETPGMERVSAMGPDTFHGTGNPLDFAPGGAIMAGVDYARALRNLDLTTPVDKLMPSYAKAPNVS